MPSEDKIVRYPDLTDRDVQLVDETLRFVIESEYFRKSKRYPAFLEFIVQNSRAGNFDVLKERILGAEIFCREPNWDAGNDSIVRNSAVEVRKRMHLYFNEHPEVPVRIDLPAGSYIAEFHFRLPETNGNHNSEPQALDLVTQAPIGSPPQAFWLPKMWKWLRKPWWRAALAAFVLLLAVVAGLWSYLTNEMNEHAFWEPVLHNNQPAVIVAGGPFVATIPSRQPSASGNSQQTGTTDSTSQSITNWSLDDPTWVARICDAFFIFKKGDCKILPASSLAIADVQNKSVILLGGMNNNLADRFLAPLRYQFRTTPWVDSVPHQERIIVDQFHPETASTWRASHDPPTKDSNDYAIVARFQSDLTNSRVVVIGGLRPEGTTSAGEFITSPDAFQLIASQAPRDWKGLNFEAVLHTEPISGNAGHVKILAVYFW